MDIDLNLDSPRKWFSPTQSCVPMCVPRRKKKTEFWLHCTWPHSSIQCPRVAIMLSTLRQDWPGTCGEMQSSEHQAGEAVNRSYCLPDMSVKIMENGRGWKKGVCCSTGAQLQLLVLTMSNEALDMVQKRGPILQLSRKARELSNSKNSPCGFCEKGLADISHSSQNG